MFSTQAINVAAGVSEASCSATRGNFPDDPTSLRILSKLNLLAIHRLIWLLCVTLNRIYEYKKSDVSTISSDLG